MTPTKPERQKVEQTTDRERALVEALKQANAAIAEYYRYWTGGETRGSYDGKPERQGLWDAHCKARVVLAQYEGFKS